MNLLRVRVSTKKFIASALLDNLPVTAHADIKFVSIPQAILSVATRDLSLPTTDVSLYYSPPSAHYLTICQLTRTSLNVEVEADDDPEAETSNNPRGPVKRGRGQDDEHGEESGEDNLIDVMDSDEEHLANAHRALSAGGVIDLTEEY